MRFEFRGRKYVAKLILFLVLILLGTSNSVGLLDRAESQSEEKRLNMADYEWLIRAIYDKPIRQALFDSEKVKAALEKNFPDMQESRREMVIQFLTGYKGDEFWNGVAGLDSVLEACYEWPCACKEWPCPKPKEMPDYEWLVLAIYNGTLRNELFSGRVEAVLTERFPNLDPSRRDSFVNLVLSNKGPKLKQALASLGGALQCTGTYPQPWPCACEEWPCPVPR